jgi:hypothetical protein
VVVVGPELCADGDDGRRGDGGGAPASGMCNGDVKSWPQPVMKYCITMLKMVEVTQ